MPRLSLTVQEARHLFFNLQSDLRQVCQDEVTGLEENADETNAEFESLWSFVDRELRGVYEMSRFALDVQELGDEANDIDVFRGNCEDYAGIEPRDQTQIQKITHTTQTIEDFMENNANYRVLVPAKIEEYFLDSVKRKQELYSRLESDPLPLDLPKDLQNLPPRVLGDCLDEVAARLSQSVELIAAVLAQR